MELRQVSTRALVRGTTEGAMVEEEAAKQAAEESGSEDRRRSVGVEEADERGEE